MELQGPFHRHLPFIKYLQAMSNKKTRTTSFSELMAVKIGDNKDYTGSIYIPEAVLWNKLTAKRSKQLSHEIYYINEFIYILFT
jgi:hypothetical protein